MDKQVWHNVDMAGCKNRFLGCIPTVSMHFARIALMAPQGEKVIYCNDFRPETSETARRNETMEIIRQVLARNACVEIFGQLLTLKPADTTAPLVKFEDIEAPLWQEEQPFGLRV